MRSMKRVLSVVMVFAMLLSCFCYSSTSTAAAKAKLKTKKATIYVKKSTTIKIKNKNKKCTYTFKSKNKKVAKVNSKGKVTGVKAGKTKIVVKQVWKKKYNKNKKKKTTTVGTFTVTVKKKKVTATPKPTATPEPVINISQTAIDRSLTSVGNTVRMKNAIEKAKAGQTVRIAYIGGSITEGAGATSVQKCYAYKSYLYFRQMFGKGDGSNVKFINAGMSGTPSSVGIVRYQRDVVEAGGGEPDILFVEFAVNDGDDVTNGLAYESLVRTALNDTQKTAVVLLFSVFKNQWNLQERFIPIGELYDLPMISIKDALVPEINSKKITNEQYFADIYHPTDAGHTVMAKCIKNYFTKVNAATKNTNDIVVSGPAISNAIGSGDMYDNIKMIDSKTTGYTIDKGSFTGVDTNLCNFTYNPKKYNFPNNWTYFGDDHEGETPKAFKITVTGKSALMLFKVQAMKSICAKADIYVDGALKRTVDSYSSGGFNNPYTACVFNTGINGTHTIEVKIKSGSEAADFTIMAFGVAQ